MRDTSPSSYRAKPALRDLRVWRIAARVENEAKPVIRVTSNAIPRYPGNGYILQPVSSLEIEHEQKILAEHEGLLEDAQRNVEVITGVVASLRAYIEVLVNALETGRNSPSPSRLTPTTLQERPTLISLLRAIMADGKQRDTDQIFRELRNISSQQFPRSSVNNRLYDLLRKGYLLRLDRGVYVLANGSGGVSSNRLATRQSPAATGPLLQTFSHKVETYGRRSVS